MDIQDYRAPPFTVEQIESRTEFLRNKWHVSSQVKINVYKLLFEEMPSELIDLGLKLVSRPAGFMGLRDAYATSKPKRIFFRERLRAQLRLGNARASITYLHELGHIILHPGAPKAWMTAGNASYSYIEEERSAEWQATMFALCFKAPTRLAQECKSAQELAEKFALSNEDAETRYEIISRRRPRKLNILDLTVGQTHEPVAHTQPVEALCPVCGTQKLTPHGAKDFCETCRSYGDKFQDGDAFGLEF